MLWKQKIIQEQEPLEIKYMISKIKNAIEDLKDKVK